jgi:hypothetical protein
MAPIPASPKIIIAQVDGSGKAARPLGDIRLPAPPKVRMLGLNYTEILQAGASPGHRLQCNPLGYR